MLSPRLLAVLRCYGRAFFGALKPEQYLFPSWRNGRHMSSGALSQACRDASQQCGLHKRITAHTLRHYATFRTMPPRRAVPAFCGLSDHTDVA